MEEERLERVTILHLSSTTTNLKSFHSFLFISSLLSLSLSLDHDLKPLRDLGFDSEDEIIIFRSCIEEGEEET